MAPIKLWSYVGGAPTRSCMLLMRYLKVDFDLKEIDTYQREQFTEEFLKINLQHCVPTIQDDNGFILWESRAILQYLAEKYGANTTLYPKDINKRAIVMQRLYFDMGTLMIRLSAITNPVMKQGETKVPDDKRQALYEALGFLEEFLGMGKYAAGDELTIADIALVASIASFYQVGVDMSKFKNIEAWYERMKSLPGFEENVDGARRYYGNIRTLLTEKI